MDVDGSACTVERMFASPPITDNIFCRLTPLSLTRMASVCRGIRSVAKDFQRRAYNINRRLELFVTDPGAFRSLMARTHMVISGSFALQFFDRTFYPESDLDIYVHPDGSIGEVGLYLIKDGYEYTRQSWQLEHYEQEVQRILADMDPDLDDLEDDDELGFLYDLQSVRAVYTFKRGNGCDAKKVQIIVSRVSPLASILDFHSSAHLSWDVSSGCSFFIVACVMNIITYNAAYSLYPYATFERRDTIVLNARSRAQEALTKYASRGWRILAKSSPLNSYLHSSRRNFLYSPWFFVDKPRWVCDGMSWTIPLDTTGVTSPPPPSVSSRELEWDPLAECGWKMTVLCNTVDMDYLHIKSKILRWQYTSPESGHIYYILQFLTDQGKLEHAKVPAGRTREDVADAWTWCVCLLVQLSSYL